MSTELSPKERRHLRQWGVAVTGRLYKASVDGCGYTAFHQKCDNKGPTLTLLHNVSGYVFGGCTFVSWNSANAYISDPKAFLFRLKEKGTLAPLKFPIGGSPNNAIYGGAAYGPTFGGGNDLQLLVNAPSLSKVNNAYYQQCGQSNFGHTYPPMGQSSNTFCGGDFNMVDIQVYSITESNGAAETTEEPWRSLPEDSLESLKKDIADYSPLESLKIKRTNILLTGPVGAGKSSVFNTIISIFRGYVTAQACSGSAEHSLTTAYREYAVRDPKSGQPMKFRLCDTMGLEEGDGLDPSDLVAIMDGHVQDKYQFNPATAISSETSGYRKSPTLGHRTHCVVFIIDSCTLDVFPEKILRKIQDIRLKANKRGIPQLVLLTKVDKLCPNVEDDINTVFLSTLVEEAVDQTAKLIGLPRAQVLPIKNYESEMKLDPAIDRLALMSLRSILRYADDFLYNFLDSEDYD